MSMWLQGATPWTIQRAGSEAFQMFQSQLMGLDLAPDMRGLIDKSVKELKGLEIVRRASAAIRKLRYSDQSTGVFQLLDIGQFQHANETMQGLLVAMPEYRNLYNQRLAAGFEDGFSQHDVFRGNAYLHTDTNYRAVTDGMVNEYDSHIWTWADDPARIAELSVFDRIDMMSNWDRMREMDWEDEDPLSQHNASC